MTLVSYAQNHEDILLWRVLKDIECGFYVDVGANDPVDDSVTKLFYDRGWSGINIEPSLAHFQALQKERKRDINLNCAAGDVDGAITFFETKTRGLSSTDQRVGENYLKQATAIAVSVSQFKLDTILAQHAAPDIHFLKIDVEGAEGAVLTGLDLARFRPWIIVVEAIDPITNQITSATWESDLLLHDYSLVFFDGLNWFFLANERGARSSAFAAPPNVLDDFKTYAQETLEIRNSELHSKLKVLETNNRNALIDIDALGRQNALSAAELNAAQQQIAEMIRQDALSAAELNAAQQQIAEMIRQDALSAAELNAAQQQIAEIMSSFSWRMTRPLREINAFRRRLRRSLRLVVGIQLCRAVTQLVEVSHSFPALRRSGVNLVRRFPGFEYRLRRALNAHWAYRASDIAVRSIADFDVDADACPDPSLTRFVRPNPRGVRLIYVYVDHTVKFASNTGVQQVVRGLSRGLIARGERVRFVRWHPETRQCVLLNREERAHLARWGGPEVIECEADVYPAPSELLVPVPSSDPGRHHWLIVPEVPHITFHPSPVTLELLTWARTAGLRVGCVFYDAIPLRRAELSSIAERHAQYMRHLLLSDVVWPISRWAGADLVAYWRGLECATEKTMPEVAPLLLSGESFQKARVTARLSNRREILCIGSVEERKNQLGLVRAFQAYLSMNPETPWKLTLVGNLNPTLADEIGTATKKDTRIRYLGHVSQVDLEELYRTCAFTVFPSVEEGFGLPIVESLWHGKPCLCANFGSMAEVAEGGGCYLVDTRDEAALREGLSRLIEDEALLERLSQEALQRHFKTWADYAGEVSAQFDLEANLAAKLGPVYFWIDATVEFQQNTGIQRVARQLARALLRSGVRLIAVKWLSDGGGICPADPTDLAHFAKWNGPPADAWQEWHPPMPSQAQSAWFLMPELPLNRSAQERERILQEARMLGLRLCAVFFDSIPWKMRSIYPAEFSKAHYTYMTELYQYDLVLPISEHARQDLIDFLSAVIPRPLGLDQKVIAAPLAGEFIETPRITERKVYSDEAVHVLTVGTVEPRKNHEMLLKAFKKASERSKVPLRLTIAGGSHSIDPKLAERVQETIMQDDCITWEDAVDDSRLSTLYKECDFSIYPSIEEGFGLPIVESLWHGRPCIAANFGAMQEIVEHGGCLGVDVRDEDAMADAIVRMAEDAELRAELGREATERVFKTWEDYALEISSRMVVTEPVPRPELTGIAEDDINARILQLNPPARPKLSVCVSTYNRAEWLAAAMRNWARLYPEPLDEVEFLVCDNASTDNTPEIVVPYEKRADFSYHRNHQNVGMLGNLRVTAHAARGEFVWILGDDDLIKPGAVEQVLERLKAEPDLELVYLNYSYTREADARKITDFDAFFKAATPIGPPGPDRKGPIREICAENENFFTAIYTLVFRRDHAIRAYSQDTSGRPFSSMATCIPTTAYVLDRMMDAPGYWIGTPQLVVNLNVSWMKYAPLWILERIPEVYDMAEMKGVPKEKMDHWRRHTLPSIVQYFQEIYADDPLGNAAYFSPQRLVRRFKHLPEFAKVMPTLRATYERAHDEGHPFAARDPEKIFTIEAL